MIALNNKRFIMTPALKKYFRPYLSDNNGSQSRATVRPTNDDAPIKPTFHAGIQIKPSF